MTKLLLAFERRVTSAIWTLACLLLALAACLGFYQVLTRFIFNEPSTWTEVSIRMILIWMVMLGTVVAFRQGALVSVDLMYRLSRGLWLKTLRLIITGISVVFLGVLVWYGAEVAWRVRFQELAGLEPLSIGWAYLALPVGAALSILAVLANHLDPRHMELDTAL
ncbi:MAG TPA: TRAP transporter small permease [Accumulibacter sp.]|uniref:TRAP transporter small permease n=1 Tax=Accumulibacter sp. TaxID=2053492 RepID=UPI0026033015|nr:TRAP transporter small permease [Accumulibacter sp.]MDS4014218.1 TRAP transporter small permease [Accumulibacter sp.]MDS4055637.1 TRAP transporter small permease [Accumulibacter sp.]HMV05559.1 TRAP transporter small permease [Accumulibacter sp.]HMW64710.1 TRAP transporter small permease [Accumulibacter sp.]HMW81331.1 TRAP transporter small permease [Accumulibacter sp.]